MCPSLDARGWSFFFLKRQLSLENSCVEAAFSKRKQLKTQQKCRDFTFRRTGTGSLCVSSAESHHWIPPKSPQLGTPPYALFVQYTGWTTVSPGDNRREIDHPSFIGRLVSSGAHLPFFLSCFFMGTVCILAQRVQTIYVTSTMRQVVSTLDTWVLQP